MPPHMPGTPATVSRNIILRMRKASQSQQEHSVRQASRRVSQDAATAMLPGALSIAVQSPQQGPPHNMHCAAPRTHLRSHLASVMWGPYPVAQSNMRLVSCTA